MSWRLQSDLGQGWKKAMLHGNKQCSPGLKSHGLLTHPSTLTSSQLRLSNVCAGRGTGIQGIRPKSSLMGWWGRQGSKPGKAVQNRQTNQTGQESKVQLVKPARVGQTIKQCGNTQRQEEKSVGHEERWLLQKRTRNNERLTANKEKRNLGNRLGYDIATL